MAPPSLHTPVDGVILAGGQARRMGGVDKGLQLWEGETLVGHVIARLRPQLGHLALNVNRNVEAYSHHGLPLWPDVPPGGRGPLDGMAAALGRCDADWLVCVPCDTPCLPGNLVQRLIIAAAAASSCAAVAVTSPAEGRPRRHPVVCLLHRSLAADLLQQLSLGERRVGAWLARHRPADAEFTDEAAFANVNTLDDLRRLSEGIRRLPEQQRHHADV